MRIIALILRIAWATHPANVHLALAAGVMVNAGSPLLYIANLLMVQRIVRARQPALGWHIGLRLLIRIAYACLVAALAMIITAFVVNAHTLDPHIQMICRALQLVASVLFLLVAVLPLLLLLAALLLPRRDNAERFGSGSATMQVLILAVSALLCLLIAGFRAGTLMARPRPIYNPAWYHSTEAFYICIFALELLTLGFLTALRIDRRFHIPDGSKGPGDYSDATKSDDGFGKRGVGVEGLEGYS